MADINALIAKAKAAFADRPQRIVKDKVWPFGQVTITEDDLTVTYTLTSGKWGYGTKELIQFKRNGKVVSRAALLNESVASWNPELLIAFEAQAPALATEYSDYCRGEFERQISIYSDKLDYSSPIVAARKLDRETRGSISTLSDDQYAVLRLGKRAESDHQIYLKTLAAVVKREGDGTYKLDHTKLAAVANEYGYTVSRQWFYKTNQKLGELTAAEVLNDHAGYVTVQGSRDGHMVRMRQQRVSKWGQSCGVFHQFPSHLYIDDKFHPEAAFEKAFKTKEVSAA
jgi:hypothetical protein